MAKALLILLILATAADGGIPFAGHFKKAAKRFWRDEPFITAEKIAEVARAESGFRADAKSKVGAVGVMQFMPGTWKEVGKWEPKLKQKKRRDAKWNILAGGLYLRKLWDQWKEPRPKIERWALTLAAYNAGLGNILAAQKLAGGARDWLTIAAKLHEVTGRHADETIGYVRKIIGALPIPWKPKTKRDQLLSRLHDLHIHTGRLDAEVAEIVKEVESWESSKTWR